MPESWVRLCAEDDVAEGCAKRVEIGDKAIAVYRVDGAFYATDDECTHGAASLADGVVDGDVIECPLHFGAFEIKTGAVASQPCSVPLRTYKVEVRDGAVFIDLDKAAGE